MRERFARAFARHFHQAQLTEAVHGGAGAVARECFAQFGQYRVAMFGRLHVDEIDDDDAAQIAQPQLARDRLRGFEVGLEDRVVEGT